MNSEVGGSRFLGTVLCALVSLVFAGCQPIAPESTATVTTALELLSQSEVVPGGTVTAPANSQEHSDLQFVFVGERLPAYYPPWEDSFGYVERYADWISSSTDLTVTVTSLAADTPITVSALLNRVQDDVATRAAIASADIVLVGPPTGDLHSLADASAVGAFLPSLREIYAEIASLRVDEPTALRTYNLFDKALSEDSSNVTPGFAAWNTALADAAGANGFVVADLYYRFHGQSGTEVAGDLLSFSDPDILSDKGSETIASVLIDTRYGELVAAGVREHPFKGVEGWLAAIFDWYGASQSDGDWWGEVWLMRPDGTEAHPIEARLPDTSWVFDWSHDGTRLAIGTGGAVPNIYEYDIATGEANLLVECSTPCIEDISPDFSADGTKLLFVRNYDGWIEGPFYMWGAVPARCAINSLDLATGEVTEVFESRIEGGELCELPWQARLSPDGTQIVYWTTPSTADGERAGSQIRIVNIDGSNDHALTQPGLSAGEAVWSPQGDWILFSTNTLNEFIAGPVVSNLYRVRPDGTGLEQLTHYETSDIRAVTPQYTPDGKWITFTGRVRPGMRLWAMPADGGVPIPIRRGSTLDWQQPQLQPTPSSAQ